MTTIGRVEFLGSFPSQPPVTGLPEVAFAGRSNVGKSSAINALLGRRKTARVSRTPGRTQLINLFALDERLCFADLPGYGYAKVPERVQGRWKSMIEGYLAGRRDLRLVVVLVDCRRTPQALDLQLISSLQQAQRPLLVVATKTDKLSRTRLSPALRKLATGLGVERAELLPISSLKGTGLQAVWARIEAAVGRS